MTNRLAVTLVASMALVSAVGCAREGLPTSPGFASGAEFALAGQVVAGDAGNAEPIEGVEVILSAGGADSAAASRTIVTDGDGNFRASGLAAGSWTIVLKKRGYADRSVDVSLTRDISLSLSLLPAAAAADAR